MFVLTSYIVDEIIKQGGHDEESLTDLFEDFIRDVQEYLDEQFAESKEKWQPSKGLTQTYRVLNVYKMYYEAAHSLSEAYESGLATTIRGVRYVNLAQFFLLMASFEGFLNLLYEIYLDPELRADTRVRSAMQREHLDIKTRMAPNRCICFSREKVISSDSQTFQEFKDLVNVRNNYIHANVVPQMVWQEVIEGQHTFWRKPNKKETKLGYPLSA